MDNTILMIAVASTLVFALYTAFASLAGDHHGIDADIGPSSDGFSVLQFFSIQSVLLGIMSLSWGWLFWSKEVGTPAVAVLATGATGFLMVGLYVFGIKSLQKLNTRDTIEQFTPEVGMHGTVYSTIPQNGQGYGVITVLCPDRGNFEFNATTTAQDPIPTGAKVVIGELNLPSTVVVHAA